MGLVGYYNNNIQEKKKDILFLDVTKREKSTPAKEEKTTNFTSNLDISNEVQFTLNKIQIIPQEFNEIGNKNQEKIEVDPDEIFDIPIANLNKNTFNKKNQEQNELYNAMEKIEEFKQDKNIITLKEEEEKKGIEKIIIPNEQNNEVKVKHTKYDEDNARRKIYGSCMQSIWDSTKEMSKKKGINFNLSKPLIKSQIKSSFTDNQNFFKKSIYNIYIDSIPKKVGEQYKNNREQYSIIKKKMIDDFLKQEIEKTYVDIKVLNKLFKLPFHDYLIQYLNDETTVIIKDEIYGEIKVDLPGFKTYKDCFNDEYNIEQKNLFKKNIISIINEEVYSRKPRTKNRQ